MSHIEKNKKRFEEWVKYGDPKYTRNYDYKVEELPMFSDIAVSATCVHKFWHFHGYWGYLRHYTNWGRQDVDSPNMNVISSMVGYWAFNPDKREEVFVPIASFSAQTSDRQEGAHDLVEFLGDVGLNNKQIEHFEKIGYVILKDRYLRPEYDYDF